MLKRRPRGKALVHDGSGFSVVDDRGAAVTWPWSSVVRAEAYKRDLLTTDLICLSLGLADGKWVEVYEELEGWEAFVASLPENLPGFPAFDSWFSRVAHPAFKTDLTSLYERQNAAG